MRVLFTVSSWATHYAAMVPLGWALQAAGHELRVLCPPGQAEPLTRAGLLPIPVLDGMDIVVANRMEYYHEAVEGRWRYPWLPLHPLTGAEMGSLGDFDLAAYRREVEPDLLARTARSFDAAVDVARRWRPDVVLHDPTSLEGLLAARVTGVPALLHLWGPVGTHEPPHRRSVPHDVSGSFPRHGLPEFGLDDLEYVIDPCPDAMAPAVDTKRVPVRFVPYNGSAPVPDWVLDPPERRRVCVSWSTALSTMSGPNSYLLPDILEAVSGLGLEVILTATAEDIAALGTVPPGVRVLERVPVRLLMEHCDAVVHHGGSGTTMTALAYGVPHLAITFTTETTVTAERLTAAGVGVHLQGDLADTASVREAVRSLVSDPAYRDRAARLRDEIRRRPTTSDLVAHLEELTAA
jgi:UDP:flavonoid glycosyltransferase YjiC (YdhE family)